MPVRTPASGSPSRRASTQLSTGTRSGRRSRPRWGARESPPLPRPPAGIRSGVAAEMARKGLALSPTLTVADYVAGPRAEEGCAICAKLPEIHRRSVENCRRAGVSIVFGTDAGGFPWTDVPQAREFALEVAIGMTPIEAIRSATTAA